MNCKSTKEVKELIGDIIDLFMNVGDTEKALMKEIEEKEDIQNDLLHELELAELNAIEQMAVSSRIKKNRKERRILKDQLAFVNTIKGYTRKFTEKGIIAESQQLLKNINSYEVMLNTRHYEPRILKDLKCSKK